MYLFAFPQTSEIFHILKYFLFFPYVVIVLT
jgi:hypothetical protein